MESFMKMVSVKQFVAIKPIVHNKLETKVTGGIAVISQRKDAIVAKMVMSYVDPDLGRIEAGSSVILPGDAALRQWNKIILTIKGIEFVLCPLSEIIGFESGNFA